MRQLKYLLASLLWILAAVAVAQDAKELSELRADTAARTKSITAANEDLEKFNAKIVSLESEYQSAVAALEKAKASEEEASNVHAADPTPANKRVLDRANSSRVLADRKLASLNKRLGFSKTKKEEAEKRIVDNLAIISANNDRIGQLVEEIALQEQAKVDLEARKAREADELAERKAEEAKLEKQRQAKLEAEKLAAAKPKVSPKEQAEIDAAKAAVKELDTYLAGDVKRRGSLHKPKLKSSIDGETPLTHLGGEIYMAELNLSAGEHIVSVDISRYRLIIADADDGELFRVYFDNRNRSKKRLMTYKSAHLKDR